MGDHGRTLQIDYDDDISMKTKLILTRFGGIFGTLKFNVKSVFKTLLGFKPYWDSKPTDAIQADTPGVYISEKITNLSKINKIHLKG